MIQLDNYTKGKIDERKKILRIINKVISENLIDMEIQSKIQRNDRYICSKFKMIKKILRQEIENDRI